MKNIKRIFTSPRSAVKKIGEEEPLFSGLLIFAVSVAVANAGFIKSIESGVRPAIFNLFALIFLWGGALTLANLIITAVQKIINPSVSSLLDAERVIKLTVVEFHIASFLLLKPLLDLFLSGTVVWVLLISWTIILAIVAVSHIWAVTEIKSALSVLAALFFVLLGSRLLRPPCEYDFSREIRDFREEVFSAAHTGAGEISLFYPYGSSGEAPSRLMDVAERFSAEKPSKVVSGFASLVKAAIKEGEGNIPEAADLYSRVALSYEEVPPPLYRAAMTSLSRIISPRRFSLLPLDGKLSRWEKVLRLWRIPVRLSYSRGNSGLIGPVKETISEEDASLLPSKVKVFKNNFRQTDFYDDICFWAGERFREEGLYEPALEYYKKARESFDSYSPAREEVESFAFELSFIIPGAEILPQRYRPPEALLAAAGIYFKKNDFRSAVKKINILTKKYSGHIAAGRGLALKAKIYEKEEEFDKAASIYGKIIKDYPASAVALQAGRKKSVIRENAEKAGLLEAYMVIEDKYSLGLIGPAIEASRMLIKEYPGTKLAARLNYSIGDYYRSRGSYRSAVEEFRTTFENYGESDYGFEAALAASGILFDRLRNSRQALELLGEIADRYPPEYRSGISGLSVTETAFRAASISEKSGDYRGASRIYNLIARDSDVGEISARALYLNARLEEKAYRRYSDAVSLYREVISNHPRTPYAFKASEGLNRIYEKGVRRLNGTP